MNVLLVSVVYLCLGVCAGQVSQIDDNSFNCYFCREVNGRVQDCLNLPIACYPGEVCSIVYSGHDYDMKCKKDYECADAISDPFGTCPRGGLEVDFGKCEVCCGTSSCVQDSINKLYTSELVVDTGNTGNSVPGPSCPSAASRSQCNSGEVCAITYTGHNNYNMKCQRQHECAVETSDPWGPCATGGVEIEFGICEICCNSTTCVESMVHKLSTTTQTIPGPSCPGRCSSQNAADCVTSGTHCSPGEVCSITYGDQNYEMTCQRPQDCAVATTDRLILCPTGGVEVYNGFCEVCCNTTGCVQDLVDKLITQFDPYPAVYCPGSCFSHDLATCVMTGTYCAPGEFCEVGITSVLRAHGQCRSNHELQKCREDLVKDSCLHPIYHNGHLRPCISDCCTTDACLQEHFGTYWNYSPHWTNWHPVTNSVDRTTLTTHRPTVTHAPSTETHVLTTRTTTHAPTTSTTRAPTTTTTTHAPTTTTTRAPTTTTTTHAPTTTTTRAPTTTTTTHAPTTRTTTHAPTTTTTHAPTTTTTHAPTTRTTTHAPTTTTTHAPTTTTTHAPTTTTTHAPTTRTTTHAPTTTTTHGPTTRTTTHAPTTTTTHAPTTRTTTHAPTTTTTHAPTTTTTHAPTTTTTHAPTTRTTTHAPTTTTTRAPTTTTTHAPTTTTTHAPTTRTTTHAPTTTTTHAPTTTTTHAPTTTTTHAPTTRTTTHAPTTTTTHAPTTTTTHAPTTTTTKATTQGQLVLTLRPPSTVESLVSAHTPVPAATAETIETHNDAPVFCTHCSGVECETTANVAYCMQGFCKVAITDDTHGNRNVEKSCSSRAECRALWWDQTSHKQQCMTTLSTLTTATHSDMSCTFCCQSNYCSDKLSANNLVYFTN